jgi:hypothetical protein
MERVCGLMVRTAENHFTANRNMEINLLLQEQRNLIPYLNLELEDPTEMDESSSEIWLDTLGDQLEPPLEIVACEETDSNIDLLNFYINLLRSGPIHQPPPPSNLPVLRKPSFKMAFDGQLTRELKNRLGNLQRPSSCLEWSSCLFPPREGNTATVARPFVVTSSKRKKSNSTRSSNFVRVRTTSGEYFYGEVIFFFSVAFGGDPDLAMAYVRRWKTLSDDNLTYKAAQGHALCVIHCAQIEELVGLVKCGDRMYVVREMGLPTSM